MAAPTCTTTTPGNITTASASLRGTYTYDGSGTDCPFVPAFQLRPVGATSWPDPALDIATPYGACSLAANNQIYGNTIDKLPPASEYEYRAVIVKLDDNTILATGATQTFTTKNTDPNPGSGTDEPGEETPAETTGVIIVPAAKYLAVGGVLSNPINYIVNCGLYDLTGVPKTNHYVHLNIYREHETVPFATARQRMRNGQARIDVSQYLMALVDAEPEFLSYTLIATDDNILAGFFVGMVEHFGTTIMPEVLAPEIRYAVNAANQQLDSDFSEYVISEAGNLKKLITLFREPVKVLGYPFSLGTIIDEALLGTQLYFERRYLDINKQPVQISSTAIPQAYYGKFLRLNILDYNINCGVYIEASITNTNTNTEGTCPDGSVSIPDEDDNTYTPAPPKLFADDVKDTLYAIHPLGDTQIRMRTNGGSWEVYPGLINIGNVNRPANYHEFIIVATDGRTESAIVGSPAFTAVLTQYTLTVVVNGLENIDRSQYDIYINNAKQAGNTFTYPAGTVLNAISVVVPGYVVSPENYSVTMDGNKTLNFMVEQVPVSAWGWSANDSFADLQAGTDNINYQGSGEFANTENIIADFHLMPNQQYAVLKTPATHKTLTAWSDTGSSLNYGQIPDSVFREPFTVGQFTYYVTRVPVDFSTGADARVVFNDNVI